MTRGEGGGHRARRARWREGAVLVTAFVLCLFGGVIRVDDTLSAPPLSAYLVAVASCAVLPARHRAPLAALGATTAIGVLVPLLGLLLSPPIAAPAVIAAYAFALAAPSERRAAGAVALSAAALLIATTPLFGELSWRDAGRMGTMAAVPLMAGVLGRSTRNRRAYLTAVQERALRAEESRESEARRRVDEERVRIARELHDLVAHQITLAHAQASVAAHLFDTRPEQTRASLGELVETTSNALDELRATVGLLRRTGDSPGPEEPTPGLARLPTLLESFRVAGLGVTVHREGAERPLPAGVDLTAYRIVQEALTNVTKHAGTGHARVGLAWEHDRLTLTVADAGAGAASAADRAPGYGLIGMRERATAVGGHLTAGPRPEGGFLVTARLPLPPGRDTPRVTGTPPADGE